MLKVIIVETQEESFCYYREKLLEYLPVHRREALGQFYGRDRVSRLFAYALEGACLASANQKSIRELVFCYNPYGKPYLRDSGCFYNLSHTQKGCVFALSDAEIGVDIEVVQPLEESLIRRFFAPEEQEYIFAKKEEQLRRSCEVWTKKEAYIKWNGKGLHHPLQLFNVLSAPLDQLLRSYCFESYYISVCGKSPISEAALSPMSMHEALRFLEAIEI